jgi:hypothetical protein
MATDDIEVYDGGIEVRRPSGGFTRVETPEGFTTLAFRNTVAGIQTWFLAHGSLPTVDDLYGLWPKIPKATYAGLMATPELKEALRYRGVPWSDDSGLSIEQQMVLLKLTDPSDRRSLRVRLREMGVPFPTYQSWLKQPLFATLLNKRTKEAFADHLPDIRMALLSKATDGDIQAIDRVLAITGEWDPSAREVQNAREVVLKVVESVVKNIQDVDLRQLILADIQASVVGFDVVNSLEAGNAG